MPLPELNNPTGGSYGGTVDSSFNATLFQWGPIQFQVWPLNIHEYDHETATDWAHKEIAGAAIYREWVGENDENLHFRGRLFPYRIGGLAEIEVLETSRRRGIAHQVIRGSNPGQNMGWFVCEKLMRAHTYLSVEGIGQMVAFEAVFARVPAPQAADYISQLWLLAGIRG